MKLTITVNGRRHDTEVTPSESLMPVLRRLGYASVKNGCDAGDCGSCAVLLDGKAVNACLVFAAKAHGTAIETLEGLAGDGQLHPLQQALLAEGAVQCGFCIPGLAMTVLELWRSGTATEGDYRRELAGNLCRCTGWVKPLAALVAAESGREAGDA